MCAYRRTDTACLTHKRTPTHAKTQLHIHNTGQVLPPHQKQEKLAKKKTPKNTNPVAQPPSHFQSWAGDALCNAHSSQVKMTENQLDSLSSDTTPPVVRMEQGWPLLPLRRGGRYRLPGVQFPPLSSPQITMNL